MAWEVKGIPMTDIGILNGQEVKVGSTVKAKNTNHLVTQLNFSFDEPDKLISLHGKVGVGCHSYSHEERLLGVDETRVIEFEPTI